MYIVIISTVSPMQLHHVLACVQPCYCTRDLGAIFHMHHIICITRPSQEMEDTNTLLVGDHLPTHHTTSLFDEDSSADVTVIGKDEGKQIRAHVLLLSSSSSVFKNMLKGDWKESEKRVVELKGFDWSVVCALISLIYSRPVEMREDKLVELYKAGHMYDVPLVMKSVARCVSGVRNKECVVELASCASTLGGDCEGEVHDVCGSYLIKCLNDIADVGRVPHKTMLAVVKSEETDLNELEVLCGVLEWSRAHKDLALEDQQELFSHIRYGQVPIEDMLEVISKGGFPCGAEFTKIMMFHRKPTRNDVLANLKLFGPRQRVTDPSLIKDIFPIAVYKSASDVCVSKNNDSENVGGIEFKMTSDLWLICNSPVIFTINLPEDNSRVLRYLNLNFLASKSNYGTYVCVKTLGNPPLNRNLYKSLHKLTVKITGIQDTGYSLMFTAIGDGNYLIQCLSHNFEEHFPWIIQVAVENKSHMTGYHPVDWIMQENFVQ